MGAPYSALWHWGGGEANRLRYHTLMGDDCLISLRKEELVSDLCSGAIAQVLRADRAALFLLDADKGSLRLVPGSSKESSSMLAGGGRPLKPARDDVPLGEGIVGHVASTGKVLRLPGVPGNERTER